MFSILFVGAIGIFITMMSIDKQTDENTTEFTAKFTKSEITDTGKSVYIEIYTEDFASTLYIPVTISKNINIDDVKMLHKSQTIYFRIENKLIKQLKEIEFCKIVSLKTEEKEIYSLSDYNRYIHDSSLAARVACVIVAIIFLLLSIYCALILKGVNILYKRQRGT